jgi:RHS repeat-associated protein
VPAPRVLFVLIALAVLLTTAGRVDAAKLVRTQQDGLKAVNDDERATDSDNPTGLAPRPTAAPRPAGPHLPRAGARAGLGRPRPRGARAPQSRRTPRGASPHLGSPRVIVNAATPADVLYEAEYTTFGERTILTGDGDTLPFGFAGGLHDPDTGLVHFGARDYDPETGRWLQKEPLGFAGGMNFYVYAAGDPVNNIDPSGLVVETAFDATMLAYDLSELAQSETTSEYVWNSIAVGTDVLALAVPFLPAVGGVIVRGGRGASRASSGARAARLSANRAAGNAARDAIAEGFEMWGHYVVKEQQVWTLLGRRTPDLAVYSSRTAFTHGARPLAYLEVKLGASRYHRYQRVQDAYIRWLTGVPTYLTRVPR